MAASKILLAVAVMCAGFVFSNAFALGCSACSAACALPPGHLVRVRRSGSWAGTAPLPALPEKLCARHSVCFRWCAMGTDARVRPWICAASKRRPPSRSWTGRGAWCPEACPEAGLEGLAVFPGGVAPSDLHRSRARQVRADSVHGHDDDMLSAFNTMRKEQKQLHKCRVVPWTYQEASLQEVLRYL